MNIRLNYEYSKIMIKEFVFRFLLKLKGMEICGILPRDKVIKEGIGFSLKKCKAIRNELNEHGVLKNIGFRTYIIKFKNETNEEFNKRILTKVNGGDTNDR